MIATATSAAAMHDTTTMIAALMVYSAPEVKSPMPGHSPPPYRKSTRRDRTSW